MDPNSLQRNEKLNILFVGHNKTPYINVKGIWKGHCYVCEKRRKTTAHHVIPRRARTNNVLLKDLRIRVCKECDKIIHAENREIDGFNIIKRQQKVLERWSKERKDYFKLIFDYMDKRIISMSNYVKKIPTLLKENKRKIHPAQKQIEGRIRELKYVKSYLKNKVNKK